MMVKVLVYGYATGVFSSRKIAKKLHEDVAFRVLAAGNFPAHRTIRDFRASHLKVLSELFVQVVRLAREMGLVKLGTVAIDGTKLKANASRHKAMSYERMKDKVTDALKGHFRPEFLNRIDETIIFDRLSDGDLSDIVRIQLQRVLTRLEKQNLHLTLTDEALRHVADQGYDPVYGARPLKRAIQRQLLDPLSLRILEGDFKDGDHVTGRLQNGAIVFESTPVSVPA